MVYKFFGGELGFPRCSFGAVKLQFQLLPLDIAKNCIINKNRHPLCTSIALIEKVALWP